MRILQLALVLFSVAVLQACSPAKSEMVRPTGTQTFPPSQFVEVLDAPPTRPFIEIGVVDAPGEPGALRTQVLAQIRSRAQQIGADAVILQDISTTGPAIPQLNPTTGQYTTGAGQTIPAFKGIAIRYK